MKDKAATDDKIMDAFAVLVNEQGYSATTTSQLAKKRASMKVRFSATLVIRWGWLMSWSKGIAA